VDLSVKQPGTGVMGEFTWVSIFQGFFHLINNKYADYE